MLTKRENERKRGQQPLQCTPSRVFVLFHLIEIRFHLFSPFACSSLAFFFLDANQHLYERSCPSVQRCVRPKLLLDDENCCFCSANDIMNHDMISNDEVFASDVPRGSCFVFLSFTRFSICLCRGISTISR